MRREPAAVDEMRKNDFICRPGIDVVIGRCGCDQDFAALIVVEAKSRGGHWSGRRDPQYAFERICDDTKKLSELRVTASCKRASEPAAYQSRA